MNLISFVWRLILKQKWLFSLVFVLSFFWLVETLFWPFFLRKMVDILVLHDGDRSSVWPALTPSLMLGAGVWIAMDGGFRLRDFLQVRAFTQLEADIRMAMFEHIQKHSPSYFNNRFAGNLASKITDMVTSTTLVLKYLFLCFIPAGAICLLTLFIFAKVHASLALIIAAWIATHFLLCAVFAPKGVVYAHLHGEVKSVLMGKIVDSLTNNFAVNLFFRFEEEKEAIFKLQKQEKSASYKAKAYAVKMFSLLCAALAIQVFATTIFMVLFWERGEISTGEIVQLFYTMWNISLVMLRLGDITPEFLQAIGLVKQSFLVMQEPQDVVDAQDVKNLVIQSGEITFENISFSYGDKLFFHNQSLKIAAGEKIGLVGYSGAGKSTFVNLILRFVSLNKGKILIDGQDIASVSLKSLREQIVLVPQDPILFHRSIKENIAYGSLKALDKDIVEASQKAHCHEFVEKLPNGYESFVGERGAKLSGGEKQRIAIARAMLVEAPILILDEATSALDSVTEGYIQEALEKLMQKRTTIVIAHRLSTLSKMDRILVFDDGKIIEDGVHEELLVKGGHYARMWQKQAGGFLPSEEALLNFSDK